MKEWSAGSVEANGLKVAYHRSPNRSSKPSILLLHGFTDNALCWSRAASPLDETYDVIMTDARGHGHTVGPVGDMSVQLLAGDAAGVLQGLGLEKAIVFGHSMGATTALAVAASYPERVRAVVLEDPPFMDLTRFVVTPELQQQFDASTKNSVTFHDLPLAERIRLGRQENPNWVEEEILPWAASKGEYNPEILAYRVSFSTFPWKEAIEQVKCPVLLLTGNPELGAITTPREAKKAAELCSQCEVYHVSMAGHCIHRDRFDETMQVVVDFLGRS